MVIPDPLGQSDAAMAAALSAATGDLLVVANGYTALVATRATSVETWKPLARGDFGAKCGEAAKERAKAGRLWWQDVTTSPATFDLSTVSAKSCRPSAIDQWLKNASKLTGKGRGKSITSADEDYLGYLAAWRCQFSGCGKDLRTQTATGTASKSSYFAHIIASSPEGPRGDATLSHLLAADVHNYMLLCDACHRRIDRQDPDLFTVDVLRAMREESINEVQRLLSSLQYREAVPVVVMGNISGQAPHFIKRAAEEGLWSRKLRMAPGHHHAYFGNGWTQHNPHSAGYWASLFHELEAELPSLRRLLQTHASPGGKDIAVFPVHATSVLLLAGRVFGEAAAAHIFQYRRERPDRAIGGKWGYDRDARPVTPSKYFLRTLCELGGPVREASVVVSLTFAIPHERLPASVFSAGSFQIPTLEVSANGKLNDDVLDSPEDLDLVSVELGKAVRKVQDEWRADVVHLVIAAPASVTFKLGQKLQARHHAVYRCYESAMGSNTPYKHTIDIATGAAVDASGGARLRLG